MAFKIPSIPAIVEDSSVIPKFHIKDVVKQSLLGQGGFGAAYSALYEGKKVVLKEMGNVVENTHDGVHF